MFSIYEGIACWLVVKKAPIFICYGFCCSIQDGIYHTQYGGVAFVVQERLFDFIIDSLCLKYSLWWCLTKHDSRRWEVVPVIGGDSHHETSWCIFNIYQCFSSYIRGIVSVFFLLRFSEYFCVLFEICLCISLLVPRIGSLFSTVITGDVVKVYLGFIFLVFFTFIISIFLTLRDHMLISDTVGLGFPIINIVRLVNLKVVYETW